MTDNKGAAMKRLVTVVMMLSISAAYSCHALTIDADRYFAYQKFGPYSAIEAPLYVLISKEACTAKKAPAKWRHAKMVAVHRYGQLIETEYCWRASTDQPNGIVLCPIDAGKTLCIDGSCTCMQHDKTRYIDTQSLPRSADF